MSIFYRHAGVGESAGAKTMITRQEGRAGLCPIASHLEELERKHGDLEREINQAMNHPSVDDLEIAAHEAPQAGHQDEISRLQTSPTRHLTSI